MLKFLTHKLRTHSLNEEHPSDKVDNEDHDSGTESDENENSRDSSEFMMDEGQGEGEGAEGSLGSRSSCSGATTGAATPSPYFLDSGLPSDCDLTYEHHSSEEELEVINSQKEEPCPGELAALAARARALSCASPSRSRSTSALPEKRKWSQVSRPQPEAPEPHSHTPHNPHPRRPLSRLHQAPSVFLHREHSSSSSDDEALTACTTPVKFRTSPPVDVHKPGQRSLSPPVKLFHYGSASVTGACARPGCGAGPERAAAGAGSPSGPEGATSPVPTVPNASPRKRHKHKFPQKSSNPNYTHRPCLDFEKMQQLKARSVTTWRPSTEHGGELSVFCW
nr:PREDICTED: uncharacterized protein LOC109042487 [Bemisia tabaci]